MGSGLMVCHALNTLSLISLESQVDLLHLIGTQLFLLKCGIVVIYIHAVLISVLIFILPCSINVIALLVIKYCFSCKLFLQVSNFKQQSQKFLFIVSSLQAEFPANTNILYVDLPSAELVGSTRSEISLPGIVLNTKKSIVYTDYFGNWHRYLACFFLQG